MIGALKKNKGGKRVQIEGRFIPFYKEWSENGSLMG